MKYWSNRIYVKKNSIFSAFLRDYWQHWSLLFESREAWNMIHGIMFVIFLWRNWMFWLDIMWHIDVSLTAQICGFNEKWKGKNNRALKAFPPSPPQPPPPKKKRTSLMHSTCSLVHYTLHVFFQLLTWTSQWKTINITGKSALKLENCHVWMWFVEY